MPSLSSMPHISVDQAKLMAFGHAWVANGGRLKREPPYSGEQLGRLFEEAVGRALATMLGGIPVRDPRATALLPSEADCVEVGEVRVIGGVRPQNFDVGYRPDGIRFVLDGKTLNDSASVRKNYQNMINDLATEATTVHSRFPYALVTFVVIVPQPCLVEPQRSALIGTLERLTGRTSVNDSAHLAEAIALVVWEPNTGTIDGAVPDPSISPLRIERFSGQIETVYSSRYKGLPPHAA